MTEFSRDQILTEINRMCEHGVLSAGSRPYELLLYLVDATLDGEEDRIKAYTIALDVFGRSEDFDPSTNSLVRVEMHRLRRALTEYADYPPKDAVVRLSIEKTSYKVEFSPFITKRDIGKKITISRRAAMGVAVAGVLLLGGAWAFVSDPLSTNCGGGRPGIYINYTGNTKSTQRVADYLDTILMEYPLISVIKENPEECSDTPVYVLDIEKGDVDKRVVAEIRKTNSQAIEWRGKFSPELNEGFTEEEFIAAVIAYNIGNSNGVIPKLALGDAWQNKGEEAEFKCLMAGHRVFILKGSSPSQTKEAFECLAETAFTSNHADSAAILAALHNYLKNSRGDSRHYFNRDEMNRAIEKAESLDPANSELLQIKLRLLLNTPANSPTDKERRRFALQPIAETMQNQYPHEPHILGQLSVLEAWRLDDPKNALFHSARARAIAPENDGLIWGTAYANLASGDWQSLAEMEDYFANDDYWYWVLVRMKVSSESLNDNDRALMQRSLEIQGIDNADDVERACEALGFGQGITFHLNELAAEFL